MSKPGRGGVPVDILAAAAGVLASWVVADLVVAIAERRRPLVVDLKNLPQHFENNERMAGVFHLAQADQDSMHITYHSIKTAKAVTPSKAIYYGLQAATSLVKLGYHLVWAYPRHFRHPGYRT